MGLMNDIYMLKSGIKSRRESSFDRKGGNGDCRWIPANETLTVADIQCAGIIRHIWFTHTNDHPEDLIRRNLILRMYWDDEENPSVESPIGDFFGQGFGEFYNYIALPIQASPAGGRGLVCYFPMPFGKRARITLENCTDHGVTVYYYVDYEVHESIPDDMGRFHAQWRREITSPHTHLMENEWNALSDEHPRNLSDEQNYVFADIAGKGHFVGVNYFVESPQPMWYGEGDDMWRIDGEEYPFSLHGTGTEDFFNGAWCPKEHHTHLYYGYAKIPWQNFGWQGRTHCYRYMIEDPIYFEKSLRASIEHGHANILTLDISSVAYWYQTEPHKLFSPLPEKSMRGNMPHVDANSILRWRDSWIREMRRKGHAEHLWGDERF